VGDFDAAEVELLDLLQPSHRRRRACSRRWWRQESGKALVAERVATEAVVAILIVPEAKLLQRGPLPQHRREGRQPRVADGGVGQSETPEPWHGASSRAAASAEAPASPTCV
jgi:hypothetical protein